VESASHELSSRWLVESVEQSTTLPDDAVGKSRALELSPDRTASLPGGPIRRSFAPLGLGLTGLGCFYALSPKGSF